MDTTTTRHPLLVARDEKIARIAKEMEILTSVFGRKDAVSVKTRLSAGARKANRMAEIHQLEFEMACEDVSYEPFIPTVLVATREAPMTEAELDAKLLKAAKVRKSCPFDSTKHTADKAIEALLKQAAKRGYTVPDATTAAIKAARK